MKNFLKLISLLCILFITPIYAQESYTLQVNGIPYQLSSPLLAENDTIYIALSQLADLSFTEVTTSKDTFTFNFQTETYTFKANIKSFKRGSENISLATPTILVDEELYVPIEILEHMNYPYEMNHTNQTINLMSPTIYSRNSDSPKDHTYIEAKYNFKNLPKHILSLSTPEALEEILTNALTNKHYISFLDQTHSDRVIDYLRNRISYPPYNTILVSYRVINTHTYPNQITDTVTLPLKIDFYGSSLRFTLGDTKWVFPNIWATYYPSHSLTQIDIQKSMDSTLMHALYEYYRNTFDLKDDKYFQPVSIITSERTNQMIRNAYTLSYKNDDSLTEYETPYTIEIQQVRPSGRIHYIIDIKLK